MKLSDISIHSWIQEHQIKNEAGVPLDFRDHLFLFDIYSDNSPKLVCYKAAQVGFCLAPETLVLTADYKWKEIRSLQLGERLIAVDEHVQGRRQGRKKRIGVVEAKKEVLEEAYKLTLSNGTEIVATAQHRFLSQRRGSTDTVWRSVEDFKQGVDTMRYFCDTWTESSYEDGWMGGILDGEGSIRRKTGTELTIVQTEGRVLERMKEYFKSRGYTHRAVQRFSKKGLGKKPIWEITTSNTSDIYKIIGTTRPSRFVNRTDWWEDACIGRNKKGEAWFKVTKIESVGKRRMIDIQTSTKTFIANGFVSHNSTMAILKSLWLAKHKRMDIIYTMPSSSDMKDFVGGKVNRIINQNPILQTYVKDKDSIEQKQVVDNIIYYRGTFTEKAAIAVSSDLNIHDEEDRSNQAVVQQYSSRLQHSKYKYEWHFSNPSVEGNGVSRYWSRSDQKHWFIKCGECEREQYLSFPESIDMERRVFQCKHCHHELSKEERRVGRWVKKYKDREFSGYWISLLMAPWVTASEILNYHETKSAEYFANFVLGQPYVGEGNQVTPDIIYRNCTQEVNTQERVVIGCDSGLQKHYVVGNKNGLFYYGKTHTWDTIRGFLKQYPRSIAVLDALPDLTEPRKLREEYPGRVFLCHYARDRKTMQIIRWGKNEELGNVNVDRNRMMQMVIDDFTNKNIPLQGTQDDYAEFESHFATLYKTTVLDTLGVPVSVWNTSSGLDHFAHACHNKDTLIMTEHGEVPITDIRIGDYVLTRKGFEVVSYSGLINDSALVLDIRLSDGKRIVSTPEHKFWTENKGFTRIDGIDHADILRVLCQKSSYSRGLNLEDTLNQNIKVSIFPQTKTSEKLELGHYMLKFGRVFMESCQKAWSFTILMATILITRLETSLVSHKLNMRGYTKKNGWKTPSLGKHSLPTYRKRKSQRVGLFGTNQQKQGNIDSGIWKGVKIISNHLHALPVVLRQKHILPKGENFVLKDATVVSMVALKEKEPVYGITVGDSHEYFANGILVANSLYWRVGMDRFRNDGGRIFTGEESEFKTAPSLLPDDTVEWKPKFIYPEKEELNF